MPKAKTYNDAVHENFKELLKIVDLDSLKTFVDDLDGDALRDFCRFCSETYNNKFFKVIIQNFIYKQVMLTADEATGAEPYWGGKMMCQGIKTVGDFFRYYAAQWDRDYAPSKEPFDKQTSFSKAKI